MPNRYAIYAIPRADTPLGAFGIRWLGRDAETGAAVRRFFVPGMADNDLALLTETPRRYGFHATLKPPFHLQPGQDLDGLSAAAATLASGFAPVRLPGLALRAIGAFVALVPDPEPEGLRDLAARTVTDLDAFRAPPSDAELARRRKAGLTARQEELLSRWGYPYVLEEFRCHFTLTGPLDGDGKPDLLKALRDLAAPATGPHLIDDIALMVEDGPGEPFRLLRRFPLVPAPEPVERIDKTLGA